MYWVKAEPLPQLTQLYGVREAQADFIFIVDTSRSMLPFFDRVRSASVYFLQSLPPDDRVFIIQFARSALLLTPDGVPAKEHASLQFVLPSKPSLSPEGDYTDIGRALEKAVALLNRPDARSLACIVFLTDGVHNPPPDSAFPIDVNAGSWQSLKRAAKDVVRKKQFFRAYGIGLQQRTDIFLLSRVFGDQYCTLLPSSSWQLRGQLDTIKQELLRERLRQLVQTELARDALRWGREQPKGAYTLRPGEQLRLRYRLSSGFAVLPVKWQLIESRQVEYSPQIGGNEHSVQSSSLQIEPSEGTLNPGQSVELRVQLATPSQSSKRLKLLSRTTHTLRMTLPYSVHAEPKEEIEQLNLSPAVRVVYEQGGEAQSAIRDTMQLTVEEGEPLMKLFKLWLLVPLLFTVIIIGVWYLTPAPFGYLTVQPRKTYPLAGQAKAKSRWVVQLVLICAFIVVLAAVGAIGGFLLGSWLSFYSGSALGAVVGIIVGWLRWGRKEVSAGGLPVCDIYLKEAHNTVRFFVRHGQIYCYAERSRETKSLSDGSTVVLAGIQATWHERHP